MAESEHIVSSFTDDLATISQKIAQMGGMAEEQLASSLEALITRDQELAEKVIESDELIDSLERDIEEQTVLLIAKRQPMAGDLSKENTCCSVWWCPAEKNCLGAEAHWCIGAKTT